MSREQQKRGSDRYSSSSSSCSTSNSDEYGSIGDISMEIDPENQEHQQRQQHEQEHFEDDALLLERPSTEWESAASNEGDNNNNRSDSTNNNRQQKILILLLKVALILVIFILIIILSFRRLDFLSSSSSSSILPPYHHNNHSPSSFIKKNYTPYDIYCTGPLLHAVQMMTNHSDNKEFVDRPMKTDAYQIIKAFETLPDPTSNDELTKFLDIYFDPAGSDLLPITPSDYQDRPSHLYNSLSNNETLRAWAMELNAFWKVLGREHQKQQYPHHHSSLLPTKHMLVVPGGRFRESYYWDTYWIVHGLLASGMYHTAKGVVQNLLDFVEVYGYVPNGGRIYYLTRSQPPILSDMVRILHQNTPDRDFLEASTRTLDKEYQFWMQENQHAVTIEKDGHVHILNRYISKATEPRPESYRKDVLTAGRAAQNYDRSKNKTYSQIIAACESGWDFSSRWFMDQQNLETVMTSNVLPVDLNTIMHRMEKNMIHFHSILKNTNQVKIYELAAEKRRKAIEHVLWDPTKYMWRDYLVDKEEFSPIVSASNFFPLWSESFSDQSNSTLLKNIQSSLEDSGLIQAGGVLTTTQITGQQWDKPNAWSPIQDILIEGLLNYETTRALGERLVQAWIRTNFVAYKTRGHMFEKYNALVTNGTEGGGGEYSIQVGFGWTNGVVLKLLSTHSSLLNNL